jgi:hypothetical protein
MAKTKKSDAPKEAVKTEKKATVKVTFKKGDKVIFKCGGIDDHGVIESDLGNGVYRVFCAGVYIAVVQAHLTPDKDK